MRATKLLREWVGEDTGGVDVLKRSGASSGGASAAPTSWTLGQSASIQCTSTTPSSVVLAWICGSDPAPESVAQTAAGEPCQVYVDLELPEPAKDVVSAGTAAASAPGPIMFRTVYTGSARTCVITGLQPGTQCVCIVSFRSPTCRLASSHASCPGIVFA